MVCHTRFNMQVSRRAHVNLKGVSGAQGPWFELELSHSVPLMPWGP